MKRIIYILLVLAFVISGCTVPEDNQNPYDTLSADGIEADTVATDIEMIDTVFTDVDVTDTVPTDIEETDTVFTDVDVTDTVPTDSDETDIVFTDVDETNMVESTPNEPAETDIPPSENNEPPYTAQYYSGYYMGYYFVDYEDEKLGEYYKEYFPSKNFNDNVTIEFEVIADIDKTVYTVGDRFWISFKATNIGEPFMFIDYWMGYFDSCLVSTEHTLDDGSYYRFQNEFAVEERPRPDALPFEDLIEVGETRSDAHPYTVTTEIPPGKYDLYIYFEGFTFIVRDALEIVNDNVKPHNVYVNEMIYKSAKDYGYTSSGEMWSLDYSLRLPCIEISPEIDEIVNGEIIKLFYDPAFEKIVNKNATFDIDYSAYLNGDIVSLVISKHEGYDISGFTYYCVNISVSQKRKLSLADTVQVLNLNYDSVISNLENPREDLFYLNEYEELIVLDYRLESPELDRYTYYAYNVSNNTGRFINELIK